MDSSYFARPSGVDDLVEFHKSGIRKRFWSGSEKPFDLVMLSCKEFGKVAGVEAVKRPIPVTHFRDKEEAKFMARKAHNPMIPGVAAIALPRQQSEPQLVAAAKRGHRAAFGELYARHSPRIFAITVRITRNRQDAEDVLQDCFLSALVHLGSFDGRSSFSTWLTRIAINSALMKLRKNRAHPEIEMDGRAGAGEDFAPYESVDPRPDPEERFADRQRQQMVTEAVRELRPALRQIIEIRELHEYSTREAAKALRISVNAAKSRLHHARVALRRTAAVRAMGHRVRRAA